MKLWGVAWKWHTVHSVTFINLRLPLDFMTKILDWDSTLTSTSKLRLPVMEFDSISVQYCYGLM